MNITPLILRLERAPDAVRAIASVVSEADSRWRPPSGNWSVLEVVCHLADEEVEDFRPRLESTLRDPAEAWPPLDLDDVSGKRGYLSRSLHGELERFAAERERSVRWLRSLGEASWENTYHHPKGWKVRAGDLLASWAAHDALHLRQIAKRIHEMGERDAAGYSSSYAGEWKA